MDASTKKLINVRSRGQDGVFYIVDPDGDTYYILGYEIEKKVSPTLRVTMSYHAEDYPYIKLAKNRVNNLGDIKWNEAYDSRSKGHHTFSTKGSHKFLGNYDEVRNWFKGTYPESDWNSKSWVNAEIRRG
jgi:hypothetical protein